MASFATHQNRQLYVVNAFADGTKVKVSEDAEKGTLGVGVAGDVDKELYFTYKGAGSCMRSDLIPVKNIVYVKKKSATDLQEKLAKVTVKLADAALNENGLPIVGQDYVLNIVLRQFYGMSDEDQYFKFGCVHVTKGMTKEDFFTTLKDSLTKNFSRDLEECFAFTIGDDNESLVIQELEQPWHLGTYAQERVQFEVLPSTVYDGVDEVVWGTAVREDSDKVIKDGKKIADLEYFCMGERGDQYRNIGWPNSIHTEYLVDSSKEYDVLEIHYAFTDDGASSYRSEKDITLVSAESGVLDKVVSEIESKSGLSLTAGSASSSTGN